MPCSEYTRLHRKSIRVIGPSIAYIELTKGLFSLVDAEDFESLAQKNWCAQWSHTTQSFYAVGYTCGNAKTRQRISVSRVLMGLPPKPMVVDHINHNTLDNRPTNLRVVTVKENLNNLKSPAKRINGYTCTWIAKRNRWQVYSPERRYFGSFVTIEDVEAATLCTNSLL